MNLLRFQSFLACIKVSADIWGEIASSGWLAEDSTRAMRVHYSYHPLDNGFWRAFNCVTWHDWRLENYQSWHNYIPWHALSPFMTAWVLRVRRREERIRAQCLVLAMSLHPRLGAHSPLGAIGRDVCVPIARYL